MNEVSKKLEKCNKLIKKYYINKDIFMKDSAIEKEILSNVTPDSKVLDAGCGYDARVISKYCDLVAEAVGVDIVEEFKVRPGVKVYTANLESLPFEDDYFDLIINRSVCEHLIDPTKVFKELKRVLNPGGKIITTTPNKYHYSSIISSLLPTTFKRFYLKKLFGEEAYENFPTYYKCNSKRQILKIAEKNGLEIEKLLMLRYYPYVLEFSIILFRIGILYDRLITFLKLDCLQDTILFVLVKKSKDLNG